MGEEANSLLGFVPSTGNLTSSPKDFFDVNSNMQTLLMWTPQQQAFATSPAGQGPRNYKPATAQKKNAVSLSFVLRRALPKANIIPSPLDTGPISQLQLLSPTSVTTFVFPINPSKQVVTKDKIRQWVLTNGGFMLQTWGNDVIKMTLSGKTSSLQPELETVEGIPLELQPIPAGVYDTLAYKNFKLLEFYCDYFNGGNEDNRLLRMASPAKTTLTLGGWGGSFDGIVSNFTYSLDADNPFRIEYSFNFEAVPRLHIPNTIFAPV